jgi:hypothetical protein
MVGQPVAAIEGLTHLAGGFLGQLPVSDGHRVKVGGVRTFTSRLWRLIASSAGTAYIE